MLRMPTAMNGRVQDIKSLKALMLVAVLIVAAVAAFGVVDSESTDADTQTLTLSKYTTTIYTNGFDQIEATVNIVNTGDKIVAESSNANVVTASAEEDIGEDKKSVVTISSATRAGTATVTVKLMNGTTQIASKTITVTVKVAVTNVEIVNENGQSIPSKKITLDTKSERTVKAKITPDNASEKKVTWKTSDATIVSVEEGKLKALKEGTAKITATSVDNTLKSDEITVEVKNVHVTSVTLEPKEATVKMNKTITLTATILPANATILEAEVSTDKAALIGIKTSQSGNVITITIDGKVAEKTDTATITIKTKDGGKTASSTITVERVAVKGVELNKEAEKLEVDEVFDELKATIDPTDATNKKVAWSTSNATVATVDENGHVKGISPGTATITVKTEEGGFTDSCVITVLNTYTIMGTIDGSGNVLNPEALVVKIQETAARGLYPSFSVLALFQESVSMSSDIIHALQKAKGGEMAIVTLNGSIYFDEDAIDNIDASGKTAGITFTEIPPETYPKFGECYLFEISMTKDGQKNPTSFGSAGPKIAIPHELAEGEDAAKLKVALVYGDGDALLLRNYKFVTDEEEDESAVVFEPPHMSTFMYMFHDSEYVSSGGFDIIFVALFLVIVLGLGGGVAFLEFHPVASEKFMNLFDNPNKPPKRPRFPGKSRKNEYDDYYNNDYYR